MACFFILISRCVYLNFSLLPMPSNGKTFAMNLNQFLDFPNQLTITAYSNLYFELVYGYHCGSISFPCLSIKTDFKLQKASKAVFSFKSADTAVFNTTKRQVWIGFIQHVIVDANISRFNRTCNTCTACYVFTPYRST